MHTKSKHALAAPIRPLGKLSDYVVEQMPLMLEKVRDIKSNFLQIEPELKTLMKKQASNEDPRKIDAIDIMTLSLKTLEDLILHSGEVLPVGSDEVLNRFRKELANLSLKTDALLDYAVSDGLDSYARDIALLDLKMLENAVIGSGGIAPQHLKQIVDSFAIQSGQIAGMTYEELILVNPLYDRRTFTRGLIGRSERDFYEIHRLIEGIMDAVVVHLWNAINLLTRGGAVNTAVQMLSSAATDLGKIIPLMRTVGIQNAKHFKVFRLYLGSNPHRMINGKPLKGASGAFSATIPIVDLLLAGENLQEEHMAYIRVNMPYFPRKGQQQLELSRRIILEHRTLNSLCHRLGEPLELKAVLVEISNVLHQFRGTHYKGVNQQLPEAMSGDVPGTGGEVNVSEFLLRRARTKHIE